MSSLSEVSCVFGQRVAELERAHEIFTQEIRRFSGDILARLKQRHPESWLSPRIRLDCPSEILFESKPLGTALRGQFAQLAVGVRFKKGPLYQAVADLTSGIELIDSGATRAFAFVIKLVPFSRYHQLDDAIWHEWSRRHPTLPPGASHLDRANVVHFLVRPLEASLNVDQATEDTRRVLDFLLGCDQAFARACGVDPVGEE